ncbi:hypothetical protein AVEN_164621-1 [Araneus ventricosus]|uniref:Uncharacterized protein n=1 Tax=Araneus ventricosus TaxID=182803 RepID=A0A4Y2P4E7_ARAVE|nr:hypothetical protein AVEN_164621-1 [Araneus ventricosus]
MLGGIDMNWTLPTWVSIYPTPCYNLPLRRRKWAVVRKDNWTPYRNLPLLLNSLSPRRLFSSSPFKTGRFWEESTLIGLSQPGYPFTPPLAIPFP